MLVHYLARHEGVAAGAASVAMLPRSGHLIGAAVLPSHRGRGLYRETIRVRLLRLRELGRRMATVRCLSDTSAPICEHLGFLTACDFEVFREAPAEG